MLIFESNKINTPVPQQDLAPILISPPHTYIHNPGISTFGETSEDDSPLAWSEPFILMFCSSEIFLIFIFNFSLSIIDLLISILCTQIERSLLSVIKRHAPYCWLAASVFRYTLRHWSKCFSKIALCTFNNKNWIFGLDFQLQYCKNWCRFLSINNFD